MQKIVSALALLSAVSGVEEAGKAAFDPEGARIRIANANRSRVAAERAEKARCARIQKEYPFCSVYAADVYASEDGRNICGLTDGDEAVAEYRLVQFPHAEWNELADACWKAIQSGCLCILGLEDAPRLLESALDQERDLGNVAEGVRAAIRGKLAHARKLLKDPSFREWLPAVRGVYNVDFAYADDAYEQYEKAIRSLTCQDATRDDVDALLRSNCMLDGILRDPDEFEEHDVSADRRAEEVAYVREEIASQAAERRRDGGAWAYSIESVAFCAAGWKPDDAYYRRLEKRYWEIMERTPFGMACVSVHTLEDFDGDLIKYKYVSIDKMWDCITEYMRRCRYDCGDAGIRVMMHVGGPERGEYAYQRVAPHFPGCGVVLEGHAEITEYSEYAWYQPFKVTKDYTGEAQVALRHARAYEGFSAWEHASAGHLHLTLTVPSHMRKHTACDDAYQTSKFDTWFYDLRHCVTVPYGNDLLMVRHVNFGNLCCINLPVRVDFDDPFDERG